MRKDIFVVGARLLGVWQLLGAINNFVFLIGHWTGYMKPQYNSVEHDLINFGFWLVVGLYLVLRPYHLYHLLERFSEDDDEDQINDSEVNETESKVK